MSPESGRDQQSIVNTLSVLQTQVHELGFPGKISQEAKSRIKNIFDKYISSPEFTNFSEIFSKSAIYFESDELTTLESIESGFLSLLKATDWFIHPLSEDDATKIFHEYSSHCQDTIRSFKKIGFDDQDKNLFHTIIQHPYLYDSDLLEKLYLLIDDSSYLSIAVLKYIFNRKPRDIENTILEKTSIFNELITNPTVLQYSISFSELRFFVTNYSDPIAHLEEYISTKSKKRSSKINQDGRHRTYSDRTKSKLTPKIVRSVIEIPQIRKIQNLSNLKHPQKTDIPNISISEYLDRLPTENSLKNKTIEEVIKEYLKVGHEFLSESTIRFYLDKKNNFTQKIKEDLVRYDSLFQQFVDRQTPLLKQVISEATRRQLSDPSTCVNNYLNLRDRYASIPESTFFGIATPYIFQEKIEIKSLSSKLIEESKNW